MSIQKCRKTDNFKPPISYILQPPSTEVVLFRLINGRVPSDHDILEGICIALTGNINYENLLFGKHLNVHHHLLWLLSKKIDFHNITTPSQLDTSYLIKKLYEHKKLTKVQLKQLIKFQILNFPRLQKNTEFKKLFNFALRNTGIEPQKTHLNYSELFFEYEQNFKKLYFLDAKHDKSTLLTLTFAAELLAGIKNIYA